MQSLQALRFPLLAGTTPPPAAATPTTSAPTTAAPATTTTGAPSRAVGRQGASPDTSLVARRDANEGERPFGLPTSTTALLLLVVLGGALVLGAAFLGLLIFSRR